MILPFKDTITYLPAGNWGPRYLSRPEPFHGAISLAADTLYATFVRRIAPTTMLGEDLLKFRRNHGHDRVR